MHIVKVETLSDLIARVVNYDGAYHDDFRFLYVTNEQALIEATLSSHSDLARNALAFNENLDEHQIKKLYKSPHLRFVSKWNLLTLPNLSSDMIAEVIYGEDLSYKMKSIAIRHPNAPEEARVWFALLSFNKADGEI